MVVNNELRASKLTQAPPKNQIYLIQIQKLKIYQIGRLYFNNIVIVEFLMPVAVFLSFYFTGFTFYFTFLHQIIKLF